MKRLAFFVYPGSGTESLTELFGGTLTQTLYTEEEAIFCGPGHPENNFIFSATEPLLRHTNSASVIYVGDWWGAVPPEKIPLPYDGTAETRWDLDILRGLAGNFVSRFFICIMFDGREFIEQQKKFSSHWNFKKFEAECRKWRNKARVALDCANGAENYCLTTKEIIIEDPTPIVSSLLKRAGFTPSTLDIQAAVENMNLSLPECPCWFSWTQKEIDYFHQIAGRELEELGYSWEVNLSYPPPTGKIDKLESLF